MNFSANPRIYIYIYIYEGWLKSSLTGQNILVLCEQLTLIF